MRAIAAESRKKLLYAWEGDRSLPPRRVAARRIPAGEPVSAVFTFLGEVASGPQLMEEKVLAVRVTPDLKTLDNDDSLRWLLPTARPGEVPYGVIERLFDKNFGKMQAQAGRAAQDILRRSAETLAAKLRDLGRSLKENLETDLADRLAEIAEEEKAYLGLVEASGQGRLFPEEERKAGGFDARRAAARAQAEFRRKEIAEFEKIDAPAPPRPLGALFLVPESIR